MYKWSGKRDVIFISTSWRVTIISPTKGALEFRGHKTVTITGSTQDQKVDLEHQHVDKHRNGNETQGTGQEMMNELGLERSVDK